MVFLEIESSNFTIYHYMLKVSRIQFERTADYHQQPHALNGLASQTNQPRLVIFQSLESLLNYLSLKPLIKNNSSFFLILFFAEQNLLTYTTKRIFILKE